MLFKRTTSNPEFDAPYNALRRRARLLHVNIKYNGVAQTGSVLILSAARRLRLWSGPVAKLGQCRHSGQLDVHGIVDVADLSVSELKRKAANRYEPTPELEFRHVLHSLKLPYEKYDFLDYGSGKGAILASAARYPFDHVIGVEFCTKLHASAKSNLSKQNEHTAKKVSPVLADARDYTPRHRPLIAYLYNPFHFEIMAPVIENCAKAAQDAEYPSYLLYKNPFYRERLDAHPALEKIWEPFGGSWAVYQFKSEPRR
ncbi:class I SAM-dependent methyltransferase [Aliiroseovarius sp. 2305UL8-7]|uniref:class I SAM-dependent methyltransferase n=1 Tax=Aliiroseovarius conchicola TaxID=3121637 RepID=UPI00352738A5